jgi:hypothetical protein
MRRHFDKPENLTNETDEEIQRDEQGMEDFAIKEGESNEDESDPEDESTGLFRISSITCSREIWNSSSSEILECFIHSRTQRGHMSSKTC